MRAQLRTLALCILTPAAVASAQAAPTPAPAADPLAAHARMLYAGLKSFIVRAADGMPEEKYAFRPTPEVRSWGEIIGHVADWQFRYCAAVLGEANPMTAKIEGARTTKPELVAALRESFAYCDRAYQSLTDANAAEVVRFERGMPRLGVLQIHQVHAVEHYGNLVTYLRLNGLVPPSSEPRR